MRVLFTAVDSNLANKKYLVGDKMTLADIAMVAALDDLMRMILDESCRKSLPNVCKWFELVKSNKVFAKYFGRVQYCSKHWTAPKSCAMKIYGPFANYRTKMVCAAADLAGLSYEFVHTPW